MRLCWASTLVHESKLKTDNQPPGGKDISGELWGQLLNKIENHCRFCDLPILFCMYHITINLFHLRAVLFLWLWVCLNGLRWVLAAYTGTNSERMLSDEPQDWKLTATGIMGTMPSIFEIIEINRDQGWPLFVFGTHSLHAFFQPRRLWLTRDCLYCQWSKIMCCCQICFFSIHGIC